MITQLPEAKRLAREEELLAELGRARVDDPPLHGVIAILMAAFGALYALAIAAIIVASAN